MSIYHIRGRYAKGNELYFRCGVPRSHVCALSCIEQVSTRGGAREGAGRKRTAPEGTTRGSHTLRASESEWEIIKDFARILKHDPERAAKMVRELKELEG